MSGASSRSRSPVTSAASGCGDISIRCTCRCSRPGWSIAPGRSRKAASSTSRASSVPAPGAGSPVRRSHMRQGVRLRIASTKMARTSRSSGCARCASAHGVGEGVVPGALVVDRFALRVAGRQRLDQRALRRGDAAGQRQRGAGGVVGAGEGRRLAGGVHQLPGEVVVRPGRVADAPMRHGAVRVGRQRLLEAGDRLLVVVAEAPVEAAVEPALRVGRGGGHLAGVAADVIRIVHAAPFSRATAT